MWLYICTVCLQEMWLSETHFESTVPFMCTRDWKQTSWGSSFTFSGFWGCKLGYSPQLQTFVEIVKKYWLQPVLCLRIVSTRVSNPQFTQWSHLHFGCRGCGNHIGDRVGLPDFTQWRWTQGVGIRPTLRRRCGPPDHRSKDSEIESVPSAPTEWTVKSRWSTFF